jgi:3-dehydroquinate dehydratase-1
MTTRKRVKASEPQIVAVIASPADLKAAIALKQLPDLFELRLDSLFPITSRLEKRIFRLRAPLIITARDPREGGTGGLSFEKRCELLLRFLPRAKYIDVELRSARKFKSLLARAQKNNIRRVLSYHDFQSTPTSRSLCAKARIASSLGADVFKVATRTDNPAAVARLIDFIAHKDLYLLISAMGIGKLGAISRLLLARCGSVLNYASLGEPNVEGQLSVALLRSAIGPSSTTK